METSDMPTTLMPPLHVAAAEGDLAAVKALIAAGAAINEQNGFGRTAAHYAVYSTREVLLELLACGADISVKDSDGRSVTDELYDRYSFLAKVRVLEILQEARELASERLAQRIASAFSDETPVHDC